MKKTTFLTLGICLALLSAPAMQAQKTEDDRMSRDIKIAENILTELFRLQSNSSESGLIRFTNESVKGGYLPDYGVIFTIEGPRGFPAIVTDKSEQTVSFYYKNNMFGPEDEVNEASVIERMKEFLKNYGSAITRLKPDENILLLYNFGNSPARNIYFTGSSLTIDNRTQKPLPVLSMGVKASDIQGFKEGKLNEQAFDKRIQFSRADREEILDLKIFAGIFETAFASREPEQLRIAGKVDYTLADNFGALFSFKTAVSASDNLIGFGGTVINIENYLDDAREKLLETREKLEEARIQRIHLRNAQNVLFNSMSDSTNNNADTLVIRINKESAEEERENVQKRKERDEKLAASYALFKQKMKEYLLDYGATLNSVKPEQYIYVAAELPKRGDLFPEIIGFQLKKTVLDEYSSNKITRTQALNRIVVSEY